MTLTLGALLGLVTGCGESAGTGKIPDSNEAFVQNTLNEVGEILTIRKTDANSAPSSISDLAKYQNGWPLGFMAMKKGDVVVSWGAPIEEGATDKILAHEKQASEAGGFVLMQDGKTVKKMTADEFKSAPKAGKG